ncbi:pyruvate kinase [Peptoniphilus ivorii]|uniref:pyruvate kinase n=1 Tax=Aedoeadaptatus ivorii TaxID=54006 RepID=UPI00277FDB8E|nr:pyruvate kinase [Peptoniphilus ivorii]MDQ0508217.1 pyruvate kinase [Peptoniphilus ivorii]
MDKGADEMKLARELLVRVRKLRQDVMDERDRDIALWDEELEREDFLPSAENLFHYLAVRRRDLRDLQEALIPWGLSSLGRLEAKTLATLDSLVATLEDITGAEKTVFHPKIARFYEGPEILAKNTLEIFGPTESKNYTRIMATLPTEAADDQKFVDKLVENGMNIARINCSHDDEEIWTQMIERVRAAEKKFGREVKISMEMAGPKIRTSWVYTTEKNPKVAAGDSIRLDKDTTKIGNYPHCKLVVGMTVPEILADIRVEEEVIIDDGTVECRVVEKDAQGLTLYIHKVNGSDTRIKSEKGINFPKSRFDLHVLPEQDKVHLAFALEHADIIGFSFMKNAQDMRMIQEEMERQVGERAKKIPILAKIETVQAVDNLASIILQGAGKNPLCVMIARGDLAVECGYVRLSELQQEIMWICEAANIPVIWATEVLANLIKRGIPTRAEITDVAEGASAECIMLNKGKYLPQGVEMVRRILEKQKYHKLKKTYMLRALGIAYSHE